MPCKNKCHHESREGDGWISTSATATFDCFVTPRGIADHGVFLVIVVGFEINESRNKCGY